MDLKEINEIMVCKCTKQDLGTLKDIIRENGLETIADVVENCNAGGFCKTCIRPGSGKQDYFIQDILKMVNIPEIEVEIVKVDIEENTAKFNELNIVGKLNWVEDVIDDKIRDFLQADGGDLDIEDIQENEGTWIVYISYVGACGSCASSSTGTLYSIENALKQNISSNIIVYAI